MAPPEQIKGGRRRRLLSRLWAKHSCQFDSQEFENQPNCLKTSPKKWNGRGASMSKSYWQYQYHTLQLGQYYIHVLILLWSHMLVGQCSLSFILCRPSKINDITNSLMWWSKSSTSGHCRWITNYKLKSRIAVHAQLPALTRSIEYPWFCGVTATRTHPSGLFSRAPVLIAMFWGNLKTSTIFLSLYHNINLYLFNLLTRAPAMIAMFWGDLKLPIFVFIIGLIFIFTSSTVRLHWLQHFEAILKLLLRRNFYDPQLLLMNGRPSMQVLFLFL